MFRHNISNISLQIECSLQICKYCTDQCVRIDQFHIIVVLIIIIFSFTFSLARRWFFSYFPHTHNNAQLNKCKNTCPIYLIVILFSKIFCLLCIILNYLFLVFILLLLNYFFFHRNPFNIKIGFFICIFFSSPFFTIVLLKNWFFNNFLLSEAMHHIFQPYNIYFICN